MERACYDRCYDYGIKSLYPYPPVWWWPADATVTGPIFCNPSLGSNSSLSIWMSLVMWHTEQAGEFLHRAKDQMSRSAFEYNNHNLSIAVLSTYTHSFHLPYLIITKIPDITVNWIGKFLTFDSCWLFNVWFILLFITSLCILCTCFIK